MFQTAWFREFRLVFGASTPASAAVLAIFMGGLGLGNAILGRRADATANPLRLYAQLELSISLLCAASPLFVALIRSIYLALGGQETLGLIGATVIRLVLAALVLGLPTFLMGGTLPAAARAVTAADDVGRRSIGWMYGLNTLGAVLGTLLSTFLLLERFGTHATLWIACGANLLNALAAWRLSAALTARSTSRSIATEREQRRSKPVKELGPASESSPGNGDATLPPGVWYLAAGIVGGAFFLMEMVWFRMLGPILGGTTFTFGLILAVALAGIGLGGALYPALFRDRRPDLYSFLLTLGWESFAIAIPFALGDRLAVLAAVLRGLASYGMWGQVLGWLVITLIVVFPAALVSGVQFPLLIALVGRGDRDVGKQVGLTFGWNTVGAMIGSLAGGFGLLSLLSATGVWQAVVMVLCVLAITLMLLDLRLRRRVDRALLPIGLVALSAVCLAMTGPTAVWRHSGIGAGRFDMPSATQVDLTNWMHAIRRKLAWQADGRESAVAINVQNGAAFLVNGKSDGNAITDAPTQIMLGALGVLLHHAPRDGLVIGLGTGESAGWMAHMPAMQSVDVVELEPVVAKVAEVCGPMNHNVLVHPKVRVIFNDAREQLLTTKRRYDLIVSEPSNPYREGIASLYTREFYRAVCQRLRPEGLFLQWLQAYEIDAATCRTVLATLRSEFAHVEIWQTQRGDLVLVCSREPLNYRAQDIQARLKMPQMQEALRLAWQTTSLEGVFAHLVASERYSDAVARLPANAINADDRNVLEYAFARTVGRQGEYIVDQVYSEAIQAGLHQPERLAHEIDWPQVASLRRLRRVADGASAAAVGASADETPQLTALMRLRDGDFAEAARIWRSQSWPPEEYAEQLWAGLALAETGNPKASDLIHKLRPMASLEADALAAIVAVRQSRPDDAAAMLTSLFVKLRSDAAVHEATIDRALAAAAHLLKSHPQHAPQFFEALSQPFAVYLLEQNRVELLLSAARLVDAKALAAAIELLEPYPPWNATLLELRVASYERTVNAGLARARRDLAEFRRQSSEPAVLNPP